ncbi:MAG: ABC transporter ATP-binding protein [Thermoplasmata archaeon]
MIEAAPAALSIDELTVRYGDRVAVREVSFAVRVGEVVALAGPNGSGKSTLLRSAVTTLPGTEGTVRVEGRSLSPLSSVERARHVAWMPQEEPPGDNVPLRDYVEYGRYAYLSRWSPSSAADRKLVAWALEEVDLTGFADRGVLELSGGERQRARLARVLAQDAPVLLLDEPTAHLDVGHQLDVLERVRRYAHARQRAVLLALHDLNLAARFSDRVVVLSHGRLRAEGAATGVLSPELLAEVWGIVAEMRRDAASGLPYLIPRLPPGPSPEPAAVRRSFRVHVVAGGGSGAATLRAAVDRGWQVSAGVLPLFDTDSELTRDLGVPAAFEVPFAPISDDALARLDALLEAADAIVVAPFPVGPSNLANLEHLAAWVGRRPIVLVDPPTGVPWDYAAGRAQSARARLLEGGAERVSDPTEAIRWLERRSARGAATFPDRR